MYPVSQTWNDIVAGGFYQYETRVYVDNVAYGKDVVIFVSTSTQIFGTEPVVGMCLSGEINLKMLKPSATIPRMAEIRPQVRVTNGTTTSEWIPQGTYFIDTREETKNDDGLPVLTMHGYDAMLKTEAYFGNVESGWPKTDTATVNLIASTIGVGIDARTATAMGKSYSISAPIGYTMRETLANIGAMYAGNWMMTLEGKLLLVTLNGIPKDTNLLIDGAGNVITFGEDAISLVDTTV